MRGFIFLVQFSDTPQPSIRYQTAIQNLLWGDSKSWHRSKPHKPSFCNPFISNLFIRRSVFGKRKLQGAFCWVIPLQRTLRTAAMSWSIPQLVPQHFIFTTVYPNIWVWSTFNMAHGLSVRDNRNLPWSSEPLKHPISISQSVPPTFYQYRVIEEDCEL